MVIGFALIAVVVMILSVTGLIEETLGICIALSMTVIFTLIVAVMAYKLDIKILTVIMGIFMVIGLVLLGINLTALLKNKPQPKDDFTVSVVEDESEKTHLFTNGGKNYYTYRLADIRFAIGNKGSIPLKEAIEGGHITLKKILDAAIPNEGTSGYKIYYDGGNGGSTEKYSIVVCENTNHVIFANYEYDYEDGICN